MAITRMTRRVKRKRNHLDYGFVQYFGHSNFRFSLLILFLAIIPLYLNYQEIYDMYRTVKCEYLQENQFKPSEENWGSIEEVLFD